MIGNGYVLFVRVWLGTGGGLGWGWGRGQGNGYVRGWGGSGGIYR